MAIQLISNLLILCICLKGVKSWKCVSPVIYPKSPELVVNAHFDLTLGCRGSEPLNWTFYDQYNKPRNHSFTVQHSINENEEDYKFEVILIVNEIKHTDVGFYYCHGKKVNYNTPLRSNRIYIFVQDSDELSVLPGGTNYTFSAYAYIPCRVTSPDVNIGIDCGWDSINTINASNYIYQGHTPRKFAELKNVHFHPYYGFLIKYHYSWRCTCRFTRGMKSVEIKFSHITYRGDNILNKDYIKYFFKSLYLEGPEEVNLKDNVTLTCTIQLLYQKNIILENIWWRYNNKLVNDTSITIKNRFIPMNHRLIIRSDLTITNVSTSHSGLYSCNISFTGDERTIILKVLDGRNFSKGPRILQMDPIRIKEFETLSLSCEGPKRMVWYQEYKGIMIKIHDKNFYNKDTKLYKTNLLEKMYKSQRIFCCDYDFRKYDSRYVLCQGNFWDYGYTVPYEYKRIPCTSISSKYNVSLKMINKDTGQALLPVIQKYEERKGFLVRMPDLIALNKYEALCIYTNHFNKIYNFSYPIKADYIGSQPSIMGPILNRISMNETLELVCKMQVYHNVTKEILQWETPHSVKFYDNIIDPLSFNTSRYKMIISRLILSNVERKHEGRYKCYVPNSKLVAEEYISITDPFNIEPTLEIAEYSFAYIGQKMRLKCRVNILHNVIFNISWHVPPAVGTIYSDQTSINTSYVTGIRYIHATNILEIKNVTQRHAGNYTCIVNDYFNQSRYTTKDVLVRIGKKAKIKASNFEDYSVVQAKLYSRLILNCSGDGDPKPIIIWKQNSKELKFNKGVKLSADNAVLMIILLEDSEGLYSCTAQNLFGEDHRELNVVVLGSKDLVNNTSLTFMGIFTILIAVLSMLLARKMFRHKKMKNELLGSDLLDIELLDYDTKWEIPKEKILLGMPEEYKTNTLTAVCIHLHHLSQTLGSGYFGYVMKSTLLDFFEDDPEKTVAIKMLHLNCGLLEINALIGEMQILSHIGNHINLVKFLGAYTQDVKKKQLLMVMEYCQHGNLEDYLIANREKFKNFVNTDGILIFSSLPYSNVPVDDDGDAERISTLELLCWALQVAQGMQFLASRKVVHGDLAARNVLLAQNNIVKIADFGLARNLGTKNYYKRKSQCPLPIKWMAIESIRDKTFSTESDVWSYGVFLWELFSLARTPYPDLQMDFSFYHKIVGGYRLERPAYCPLEIYNLMSECWQLQPARRPTFHRLVDDFCSFLPSHVRQDYILNHQYENLIHVELHSDPNDQQDNVQKSVCIAMENSPVSA